MTDLFPVKESQGEAQRSARSRGEPIRRPTTPRINIMRPHPAGIGRGSDPFGHNRSVDDVVTTASRRRAGIALSFLPRAATRIQVHGRPAQARAAATPGVRGGAA